MTKQKIKICLILLFIILIILSVFYGIIRYFHSVKYINSLIENSTQYINYSEITDDMKVYFKGNRKKIEYNNGDILYYNFDDKKMISIIKDMKRITISNINDDYNKNEKILENEYHYNKNEKINNIDCIVVDIYDDNEKNEYLLIRKWINKELGTLERIASYNVCGKEEKLIDEQNFNYHTNTVTDEKISEPNLNDYDDYEIVNNT